MWSKKYKGFTIVEMLVVVAIIGILATVMMLSIGNSVVKSRDSKRMADISMINKAVGLFAAEKKQFPRMDSCAGVDIYTGECVFTWQVVQGDETTGSVDDDGDGNWTPSGTNFIIDTKTYLPSLPTDPKNAAVGTSPDYYSYQYYSSDQSSYYLRALLELDESGNFGTKKCFGFFGSKNSSVSPQASWGNEPGPTNGCR